MSYLGFKSTILEKNSVVLVFERQEVLFKLFALVSSSSILKPNGDLSRMETKL